MKLRASRGGGGDSDTVPGGLIHGQSSGCVMMFTQLQSSAVCVMCVCARTVLVMAV